MGGKRDRAGAAPQSDTERELNLLFPHKLVTLSDGTSIAVERWSISKGFTMTGRLVAILRRLREENLSGDVSVDKLIEVAAPECLAIVRETIGWNADDFEKRFTYEDFLGLLSAVFETSLLREDGGGVLPKVIELAGVLGPLVRGALPSSPSSTS